MNNIKKYVLFLFVLFFFLTESYGQNLAPDGDFEQGCNFTGWTSNMYNNCGGANWSNTIENHNEGVFTIGSAGSAYVAQWSGVPHSGNYYFIGDGYWNSVPANTSDNAYTANIIVYPGNTYAFNCWYYNEQPGKEGQITLAINNTPYSVNNPNATGWVQMGTKYIAPSGTSNITVQVIKQSLTTASSDLYNDFGLDDIYFGLACDNTTGQSVLYYQNTLSLPPTSQAGSIIAGFNVTSGNTTGNVIVGATQNITFTGGASVVLQPGFSNVSGGVFLGQIGQVASCQVPGSTFCSNCRQGVQTLTTNNDPEFMLYPNPSTGKFNLNFNYLTPRKVGIEIHNMIGNQVFFENIDQIQIGKTEIDLTNEPEGMYIVKVTSDNEIIYKKVVLSK
jgi:hypothetical protein